MFLLVMAFSYMVAQIVMKNREDFTDEEGYLINCEGHCGEDTMEVLEEVKSDKDIFFIGSRNNYKIHM